jgi:hypothetical protein
MRCTLQDAIEAGRSKQADKELYWIHDERHGGPASSRKRKRESKLRAVW